MNGCDIASGSVLEAHHGLLAHSSPAGPELLAEVLVPLLAPDAGLVNLNRTTGWLGRFLLHLLDPVGQVPRGFRGDAQVAVQSQAGQPLAVAAGQAYGKHPLFDRAFGVVHQRAGLHGEVLAAVAVP